MGALLLLLEVEVTQQTMVSDNKGRVCGRQS